MHVNCSLPCVSIRILYLVQNCLKILKSWVISINWHPSAGIFPALFVVAASYAGCNKLLVVVSFVLAMAFMGNYYPGMRVNVLDLSPNYAGTIIAITNGAGSLSGVIVPTFIGYMTPNVILEMFTKKIVFSLELFSFLFLFSVNTWSMEIRVLDDIRHWYSENNDLHDLGICRRSIMEWTKR